MPPPSTSPSARETELLELAYEWTLEHGLSDLSLRPLAAAIGSSPRVLLFLFGSKEELVRRLLARAREDELAWLRSHEPATRGLAGTLVETWAWLADPAHDALLRIWVEAYARSLVDPTGPWGDFARTTVEDWIGLLARAQPASERRTARGRNRRTLALAVLRGGLLDLLATGDRARVDAAVRVAAAELELPG
ncbi:TetR/AcrR family transcriptional regulator [Nocardioides sp. T2.26MG-1]|uniref:TetR/AcrR family transcriptional regulator n=1 Tax=Nocardioides sp. T2.26MG-1 TaxID=3041166 RepID=UPI002541DD14|nr:TetR/AcrR family transcriptional regulator [Nocardioides sp. T2.26MG-1]